MKPGKLFDIGAIIQIIIQIIVVIAFIWLVVTGISYVHQKGLKHIVNEVWEGTEVDSTNNK